MAQVDYYDGEGRTGTWHADIREYSKTTAFGIAFFITHTILALFQLSPKTALNLTGEAGHIVWIGTFATFIVLGLILWVIFKIMAYTSPRFSWTFLVNNRILFWILGFIPWGLLTAFGVIMHMAQQEVSNPQDVILWNINVTNYIWLMAGIVPWALWSLGILIKKAIMSKWEVVEWA